MKLENNLKRFSLIPFTIISLFFILGCTKNSHLTVTDLKCNHLINPLGINSLQPHFSWINIAEQQGASQSAYQILVASSSDKLSEQKTDYWDSGKTGSSESNLIQYTGDEPNPGQTLYWKVRVWNENDRVSAWSEPAKFSIGLLEPSDWSASYIGYTDSDLDNENMSGFHLAPQFRKQFVVDARDKKERYVLHVNSLGYHEVYLNGNNVSDDVLSPAVTQFNKRSLVNTYDITDYIKSGQNDLIIWIGSGWYSEGLPGVVGNGPVFKAQLENITGDKNNTILVSDESWSARNSEYERIGNWRSGQYGGEIINGNLETRNVVFESPDDVEWNKVTIVTIPVHEVTPQMTEPNRIKKTINPVSTVRLTGSSHLIDMGTTITGWFEILFPGLQENQEITIEYSDHLNEKGELYNQGQVDKYIASGRGTEHFINKFNYHGFRYVKISNLQQEPILENIKAHFIHTDFETTSTFVSSDEELNSIHDMVSYTLRNVGLGGYLVDCPQIERLGYGGDGNASTIAAQIMFNLAPLYNNWLQAWGDVIRENGDMPYIAPNPYNAGGGPFWSGFIISASWNTYQNYGDKQVLEKYYPVMLRWLEFVDKHSVEGLLEKWPNTDYRNWYLGDWATPDGVGNPDHVDERSVDLVNNCYISVCFSQMEDIASVLDKEEDKKIFAKKRNNLNKKIHDTFYNEGEGYYGTGSQIDIIFPMLCGAAPDNLHDDLVALLISRTENEFNGHLNTGLVGIPVMMAWAETANQPDFVYSMLKKKTYPGYLYMIENGATTTWEHWNGERSRIHNCYNGVGQWFYQVVGGIRTIKGVPAYKKFVIDPQIPNGVTWAKTTQRTPYGKIVVNWELYDEKMAMEVEVPIGTTGILQYPDLTSEVIINNELVSSKSGRLITQENQYELESGKHFIEFLFLGQN
jgi:alpha-L-rhamnosidase